MVIFEKFMQMAQIFILNMLDMVIKHYESFQEFRKRFVTQAASCVLTSYRTTDVLAFVLSMEIGV